MNTTQYKEFCEAFFKEGSFKSKEELEKKIANKSPHDFQGWQNAMITKYDEKQSVIREMIKVMREKENYNVFDRNSDREKDPIHTEENQALIKPYRDIYNQVFNDNVQKYEIYMKKQLELHDYFEQKQLAESLKVTVDDKKFVAEKVIDVLWSGWECDSQAWLVNDEGQMKVIATNHGGTYFADKSFLEEKIKEYEIAIANTKEMLSRL